MKSCANYIIIQLILFLVATGSSVSAAMGYNMTVQNSGIDEPRYAPAFPYILSYARTDNHKRTLHLVNQNTSAVYDISQAVIASNDALNKFFSDKFDSQKLNLDYYSGELDWRPVLDSKGRQWYTFISSTNSGELVLNFNYLDSNGVPIKNGTVQFSFQGEIRSPKWSPDGNMLVFSSRNQLFLLTELSEVIHSGSTSGLAPVRLTQTGESNLYPDWSPSGRHIAYQSTTVESGVRNSGISVISIDYLNPQRISTPVKVTAHLYNFNEYLPSWSPDANYIAYYISREPLYMAQSSEELDIGFTQLFSNPGTGAIIGGRTGQASAQRIAHNVFPQDYRGPEWIYMDEGNPGSLSIIFLSTDTSGNQRVRFTRVNEFTSTGSAANYPLDEVSSLGSAYAVNNFSFIAIERKLRVTQVVDNNNNHGLHYFERSGNFPVKTIFQERNRSEALWRSMVIPGFGQYYKGQHAKGAVFFGASALTAGTNLYLFFIERPALKDDRTKLSRELSSLPPGSPERTRLLSRLEDKNSSIKSNRNMILGGTALFAGIWALNVIDSSLGFPVRVKKQVNSGVIQGEFGPRFSQGSGEIGFYLRYDF